MRRLWADVILVLLVMCLAGCKRWDTEYQEINIAETEAVSDREEADSSYQDKFAKGYDLSIAQTDIDQAENEMEDLLDMIS